jgi:uncharacterized protein (DUF488 family)
MNPGNLTVFTIGHSNHPLDTFVALLSKHGVTAVADVRSAPYSRFAPQFNKANISATLKAGNIEYVFLGKELGARSEDPACYEDGRVCFERLAQTALFLSGIERVLRGAEDFTVALMCAEKDPIDCHRAILVARKLTELDVAVSHILADGTLESHLDFESRLLAAFRLPGGDMFRSRSDCVTEAYLLQAGRMAYRKDGANRGRETV